MVLRKRLKLPAVNSFASASPQPRFKYCLIVSPIFSGKGWAFSRKRDFMNGWLEPAFGV